MDGTVCKAITPPDAEISTTRREVTSYKSMWGGPARWDRVREFTTRGESFGRWAELPNMIANGHIPTRHNHQELVGKMIHAEEDAVGLLTTDKYGVDPVSDRVFSLVREKMIPMSSFTARYKASDRIKHKGSDGQPVWELRNLILVEAGPADSDRAVNQETRVVAVKGLQEVASVLSNLAGLDGQEVWTVDSLKRLSPEDKDALMAILSQMPHGMACEAILAEMQGEAAEDQMEAATGKAMQLSDAIAEWQVVQRIEKFQRRLSAAN